MCRNHFNLLIVFNLCHKSILFPNVFHLLVSSRFTTAGENDRKLLFSRIHDLLSLVASIAA